MRSCAGRPVSRAAIFRPAGRRRNGSRWASGLSGRPLNGVAHWFCPSGVHGDDSKLRTFAALKREEYTAGRGLTFDDAVQRFSEFERALEGIGAVRADGQSAGSTPAGGPNHQWLDLKAGSARLRLEVRQLPQVGQVANFAITGSTQSVTQRDDEQVEETPSEDSKPRYIVAATLESTGQVRFLRDTEYGGVQAGMVCDWQKFTEIAISEARDFIGRVQWQIGS